MTDKEKIFAEIERLRKNLPWGSSAAQLSMECNCKNEAYTEIEKFLNSLPEEPVRKELEEAADIMALDLYPENIKTYCGPLPGGKPFGVDDNIPPRQGFIKGFKAGAKWQKKQIEDIKK